jgi:hypothetical protein
VNSIIEAQEEFKRYNPILSSLVTTKSHCESPEKLAERLLKVKNNQKLNGYCYMLGEIRYNDFIK